MGRISKPMTPERWEQILDETFGVLAFLATVLILAVLIYL
jgi:hypothetical protein